jgi:hypothetical protein
MNTHMLTKTSVAMSMRTSILAVDKNPTNKIFCRIIP